MKRFLTPLLSLFVFGAMLSSCTNVSRIIATGLEIEVTALERSSDGTVTAAWNVKNPNIVSYLFSRVNHKIQLNGVALGTIDESEPLALPASSNAGRTSKLTGINAAANATLTEAALKGSASYRIDSQITILIYDDNVEKSVLTNSGTVPVRNKEN